MANYNPAGYVPIRIPNVYQGYTNAPRLVRPQLANFMTPNGMVQGVHRNVNGNPYVPNMIAMNNMVNNPRFVNQMRVPTISKPNVLIGRLLNFVEWLGNDVTINNLQQTDIQYWKFLTHNFFSEDVVMKYTLHDEVKNTPRSFEFTYNLIPRFYLTFIESGVVKIQLILGSPKDKASNAPNGQYQIECPYASIEYHFSNGIQVTAPSSLVVTFNNMLKMTSFELVTTKFTEYVPRNLIPRFAPDTVVVNEYGIPSKTLRCLEIAEGVDYMRDVIALTIRDAQTGPIQACRVVTLSSQATPTISSNPNPNQRMQTQPNGKKDIKNEPPNYNGAPPTPNTNDLHAAPTPASTPPAPTPTPTPSLTPSPLVPNINGISSPRQKLPTNSPALSEQKRGNDNGSGAKAKQRRQTQNKTKNG